MVRFLFPLLLGIVGCGILVSLGSWQVDRLAWKEAILAEIDARIFDAPVALPVTPDEAADKYLAVAATGTLSGPEIHVLASAKGLGAGLSRNPGSGGRGPPGDGGFGLSTAGVKGR